MGLRVCPDLESPQVQIETHQGQGGWVNFLIHLAPNRATNDAGAITHNSTELGL